MNLELNARTFFVALLIALGAAIEVLKVVPNSPTASTVVAAVEEHLFSGKPYAVAEKTLTAGPQAKLPALPKTPVVAFDMKDAVAKFNKNQEKVLADQKKAEQEAKSWHWVYNRKLGKWLWKKKTPKKEKATADDTQVAQTPTVKLPDTSANANSDGGLSAGGSTALTGSFNAPAANPAGLGSSNRFLSKAEWEALLLKTPNASETKYFAQQFNNHLVTDTVFYAIVDEMLKDSRVDMQQQGVLALSLAPSADSFTRLAKLSGSSQTSSPLSSAVTSALNAYQQTKNLDELQTVLKQQKDNTVLAAALKQLQASITSQLSNTGSNPGSQGGTNKQIYQAFIPILNSLTGNSAVASQVNDILRELNASSLAQF